MGDTALRHDSRVVSLEEEAVGRRVALRRQATALQPVLVVHPPLFVVGEVLVRWLDLGLLLEEADLLSDEVSDAPSFG